MGTTDDLRAIRDAVDDGPRPDDDAVDFLADRVSDLIDVLIEAFSKSGDDLAEGGRNDTAVVRYGGDRAGKGSTARSLPPLVGASVQSGCAPVRDASEPHRGAQSLADDLRDEASELCALANGKPYVVGVRPQDLIGIAQELDDYAARADALTTERDRLVAEVAEHGKSSDLLQAGHEAGMAFAERKLAKVRAERDDALDRAERAEAAVARVRKVLTDDLEGYVNVDRLEAALDGVDAGGEGGAADDEHAALNRLRALSVDRDEYLLRLRQAEHIAQVGGVDDETLRGLLHIAVVGQVTPSAERALRLVGIDVRCHDHDHQQHDERPVSGAGMGERE